MLWIKHLTAFARQEVMVEISHELGNSACYGVWLLLERIGEAWTGTGRPELCLPAKEWWAIAQLPQKKFVNLLAILQAHNLLETRNDGKKLAIHAPILLQLLDEGTRKRRKAFGEIPDSVRNSSGLKTDTHEEPDQEKEQNTCSVFSEKEKRSLRLVLRRKGITPESPMGESWLQYVEKQQPRNPAAYLTTVLQTNPYFDPRTGQSAACDPTASQGECLHVGELLTRMGFSIREGGP